MESYADVANVLAAAFVAGDFNVEGLVDRGSGVLRKKWRWLRPLARRVAETFVGGNRRQQIAVVKFVLADRGFRRACERHELRAVNVFAVSPMMCPFGAASSWSVPSIRTSRELAEWLGVTIGELDWFADLRGLERKCSRG